MTAAHGHNLREKDADCVTRHSARPSTIPFRVATRLAYLTRSRRGQQASWLCRRPRLQTFEASSSRLIFFFPVQMFISGGAPPRCGPTGPDLRWMRAGLSIIDMTDLSGPLQILGFPSAARGR
jgi:hypothetical protein